MGDPRQPGEEEELEFSYRVKKRGLDFELETHTRHLDCRVRFRLRITVDAAEDGRTAAEAAWEICSNFQETIYELQCNPTAEPVNVTTDLDPHNELEGEPTVDQEMTPSGGWTFTVVGTGANFATCQNLVPLLFDKSKVTGLIPLSQLPTPRAPPNA